MRTFFRTLRIISAITLFFFCWTYMPLYSFAASAVSPQEKRRRGDGETGGRTPGEKFEKALEEIWEKVGKADDKAGRGDAATGEIEAIRKQRIEIEKIDVELKKEFAATEKKLKDAKLPKEILDRHYKFVKHYEDNLTELKKNLSAVEKPSSESHEQRAALQKAKAHLEKVRPPKKHVPLNPNKLPHRMVKAKSRAPRLKKEEFEKDFGPQKKTVKLASWEVISRKNAQVAQKFGHELSRIATNPSSHLTPPASLVQLAYNDIASDVPFQLPLHSGERTEVRGGLDLWTEATALPSNADVFGSLQITASPSLLVSASEPQLLAASTLDLPTSDDIAETPEVQFSQELQKIATLLENNPVQLYEFVRNNFTFDPYYGSVKGSQSTLLLQSGNDFDQASVLIALFRVSGIPARYVCGTVEIPIEKVMKWLGGITDPDTAGAVLVTNGIPAKLILSGGTIKSVQLEHTWIEVYISYTNYRGLINDSTASKTWIPLDPSFKLIDPNQNVVDLADAQQFDIDSYLTSYLQTIKPTTPAKDYLSTTINYVMNNLTGQRFYDLLASGPIIDKVLGLLPDTLSYPVKTTGAKFSSIPDSYRQKITFEFSDPVSSETVLAYTASWANLLHNRVTISYIPATTTDELIIANYGDIYSTPSYLINVKPILKLEGAAVAEGNTVGMGGNLTFKMSFIGPQGLIDRVVTNNLTVGATHAIGLGSGYTTGRIVTNRTAKLEAAVNAGQTGEPIIGEYLNLFAVNYLQELDSSRKLIAKSMKTLDTNRAAELMVGVDLGVSTAFGIPKAVNIRGVLIDVDYNIATPVNIDGDQTKVRRFQILAGMTSSALEHSLFESIIGVEAVSAIKALEVANAQGIPIHQIDASNIATKLSLLQLSSAVITDIQNAVNAGKVVTVSERNIQLNSWNGVGYVVLDPVTGAGAYLISGGISGGCLSWVAFALQRQIASGQMDINKATEFIVLHKKNIWFWRPVWDSITSGFGWRTLPDGTRKWHDGIDFGSSMGTPVVAAAGGKVTIAQEKTGYGLAVYIDHGAGVQTRYAHNSELLVKVGQEVSMGQTIAKSGNTGTYRSTLPPDNPNRGAHVHFEIRLLVPDNRPDAGAAVDPNDFANSL